MRKSLTEKHMKTRRIFLKTLIWLKRHLLPIAFVLIGLGLSLEIASQGPYFFLRRLPKLLLAAIEIIPLILSAYFLGGSLGVLCLYLIFSFLILETILAFATGNLSNDFLQAFATSGGAHHFKLQIFLWLVTGILLVFFLRKKLLPHRKISGFLALFTAGALLFNLFLGWNSTRCPVKLQTSPSLAFGFKSGEDSVLPLKTPQVLSMIGYEFRQVFPGPLGDLFSILAFAQDPGADQIAKEKHPLPAELKPDSEHEIKNIVLIIGESSTAKHYSAYGYDVPTTPFLKHEIEEEHACAVSKAHSVANLTKDAVLPSVSLWKPTEIDAPITKLNLVELANRQGYQTYWASVQSERGSYSGFIGYVAKYADYFIDPETRSLKFHDKTLHIKEQDEAVLPLFKEFAKDDGEKKLIILHLWGSHVPYGEKIRKEDKKALPKASPYDQSLHRTDRILKQITEIAQDKLDDPLIFYVSDHGEDTDKKGHGLQYGGKDYFIPVILLGKKAEKGCKYLEHLRSEDGYYSSNMNKFLMMRLLGMKADDDWIDREKNPDLVLHMDHKKYPWGQIPGQKLD
ncbi:hypothetical protein FAI40_03375 [Acetobacteraceae bacterium]|nr:hypothetical protein FAI40_03375 [Acetobacteraceae bacterium]